MIVQGKIEYLVQVQKAISKQSFKSSLQMATTIQKVNMIDFNLEIEWDNHGMLSEAMENAQTKYDKLMAEIYHAKQNISIITRALIGTEDAINELSITKEDMIESLVNDEDDIWEESNDYEFDELDTIVCAPRERKVRSDVLTVGAAIKCNKSSKQCKLKPKNVKKDRSKSSEAKALSKKIKASHA